MSTWGKPKPTNPPKKVWGKPGWSNYDPEWCIKVPWRPPLLNQYHPPNLEVSTCPTKNTHSSKNFTQFDTLPSDTIHIFETCYFSLVHNKILNKVLVRLTHQNPLLCSTSYYKPKYLPFDDPIHYNILVTCGRTGPYSLTHPSVTAYG